jgi:hypothetical protein
VFTKSWNHPSSPPVVHLCKGSLVQASETGRLLVPHAGAAAADGRLVDSVRDMISPQPDLRIGTGSPDRFPDPRRALIGGACRSWQWAPPRAAPYKRGASRGTGTNVHRARSAATNPNPKTDQRGAEARGLAPPRLRLRPTTSTPPCLRPHRPKVHPSNP